MMSTLPRLLNACTASALPVLLASCAATRVTSQTAPEFKGKPFAKILVLVDSSDLEERQHAERAVVDSLAYLDGQAVSSLDVVFAGSETTTDQFIKAAESVGADALLCLVTTDRGETLQHVPTTSFTNSSASGSAYAVGDTVYGQARGSSTTQTFGGGYVAKPWATYEARLIDVQSGHVAWYATARTNGNSLAGRSDLAISCSRQVALKMAFEGVVISRKPNWDSSNGRKAE